MVGDHMGIRGAVGFFVMVQKWAISTYPFSRSFVIFQRLVALVCKFGYPRLRIISREVHKLLRM